jgi:hypothetical protein
MLATIYASYRSIFTENDELAEDAP